MILLKSDGVCLGYDKKCIAHNISFEVHEGDYIAVTGENGAGKSTLVKTLLGLIPTLGGKFEFCRGMSSRDIGYLPQSSYTQKDFPASVFEVVLSGCIADRGAFPFYRASHKALARENMKKTGIEELSRKSFSELSGGQAQRVLLSRALCAAKKLLLLDEPVRGLDVHATHEMYNAVKLLHERENMAVIMVSHDICSVLAYASHVLHLGSDGYFFGTVDEYRRSEVGRDFIYAHGGDNELGECSHGHFHENTACPYEQKDGGERS